MQIIEDEKLIGALKMMLPGETDSKIEDSLLEFFDDECLEEVIESLIWEKTKEFIENNPKLRKLYALKGEYKNV